MNPDWSELRELHGRDFLGDSEVPRENWIDVYLLPEDRPYVLAAVEGAVRSKSMFELEHRVRRPDGSLGWMLSRALPLLDDDGEIYEWVGTATNVSHRREMEGEVARLTAVWDHQRRFYESLISATPDLVYAFDRDYRFIFANKALLDMWGRTLEESKGKRLLEVGYEPWHAEMHEREIDEVVATKAGIRGEVGFPHATLGWRIYDYIFMPVLDAFGEVEAIAGTTRDITDIKRSEEHLRLLVNELNHRVKNTLTTVQSLARQTFRSDAAKSEARAAFEQRLIALSNAHTALTRTNWESASLCEIATLALSPFDDGAKNAARFHVDGEDLALAPQTALALAMAFHELASNAVKYGALSTDAGQVWLSWDVDQDPLRIVWREEGGPAVREPSRRGFGSQLLQRSLARELDGSVSLEYASGGVVCTIGVPIAEEVRVERG